MRNAFAAVAIAAIWIGSGSAQVQQPPASLAGEWKSVAATEGRPNVTLTLATTPALSGSVVVVGERQGARQWTTVAVDRISWDGAALTFDARIPGVEGDIHWTLRSERPNQATLTAIAEEASPHEDPTSWDMVKP
jgi:hypothetical protein